MASLNHRPIAWRRRLPAVLAWGLVVAGGTTCGEHDGNGSGGSSPVSPTPPTPPSPSAMVSLPRSTFAMGPDVPQPDKRQAPS